MAKRRMFSLDIVDSDKFLDMPQSAQNLYFALGMRADDDGFVSSPKRIVKSIGANEDDFNILILKSFVIKFDSGIMVVKHWKMHNHIQKDRYFETIYKAEKSMLKTGKNKEYVLDTKWIQNVSKIDPQVRIGKESLVEISPSINQTNNSEKIDRLKKQIQYNIDYDILSEITDKEILQELVTIITDTIQYGKEYIRISNSDISFSEVKSRLLSLDSEHIKYVIECFKNNKTKVKNIKSYLLACLYNAPSTFNSYYTAEVNHNM